MARKLVNFCLAWTLVLGCWGGVLAAAACPHVGCETPAAAPQHPAGHGEHSSVESQDAAVAEDHSAHHEGHRGHGAEPANGEQLRPEPAVSAGVVSDPHEQSCAHCVGRPEAPPSSGNEWRANSAHKPVKDAPSHTALQTLAPSAAHLREIVPAQHAPPGRSDRHLLLSVFRI